MDVRALRIAVYSEVGDPESPLVSGVTNLLHRLLDFGSERDLDLALVTFGPRNERRRRGSVGIRTLRPRLPLEIYRHLVIDLAPPRRRVVRREVAWRPDVVIVVAPGPMGALGARVAKACAAPLIALYTTDFPAYLRARVERLPLPGPLRPMAAAATDRLAWRTQRRVYDRADRILAPSEITAREIRGRFAAPVGVLGRGVDVEQFRPRASPGRPAASPTVLYVGRIHMAEKNLGRLIELADALPEARLRIVGDGPDLEPLRRRLGERAELLGELRGAELTAAYREADLFVFPSIYDTLGQVVLEAMASGLPVVVTDRGGPQELVRHGRTGLVTPEPELVERTAELARDPQLRARMGRAARTHALTQTWERTFDRLLEICGASREGEHADRRRARTAPATLPRSA